MDLTLVLRCCACAVISSERSLELKMCEGLVIFFCSDDMREIRKKLDRCVRVANGGEDLLFVFLFSERSCRTVLW